MLSELSSATGWISAMAAEGGDCPGRRRPAGDRDIWRCRIEITDWLRGLGLEQYATAFRDNDIDDDLLWRLTAEDLRELGVASVVGCSMPSPPSALSRPRPMRQDCRSKLAQLLHQRAMRSAGT